MKNAMNNAEVEYYTFGNDNKLRVFPPNTFKFKPKDHIFTDEVQQCLLDNLWFQYNNKREDKGYFLAILNSLSEYFHLINGMLPSSESPKKIQVRPLYILFNGKRPGIYTSYEQIVILKNEMERKKGTPSFAKYMDVDEALAKARMTIGPNYYIEPSAREYIQNYRLVQNNNKSPEESKITKIKEQPALKVKEEGNISKNLTYKEVLKQGIDPLDGEYIDFKIEEKFEEIEPKWKEDIKNEILKDIKKEINEKFEELKKICDEKYTSSFLDEEYMDIGGHGQDPDSEQN